MKKIIQFTALVGALTLSTAAFAEKPATTPPENTPNRSDCGAVHAAAANVNGNFGFIGQEFQGAPNYHGGIQGQEPGATGYNNSHTDCQNNPN
jgi:uncharacterized low-complexity protein